MLVGLIVVIWCVYFWCKWMVYCCEVLVEFEVLLDDLYLVVDFFCWMVLFVYWWEEVVLFYGKEWFVFLDKIYGGSGFFEDLGW